MKYMKAFESYQEVNSHMEGFKSWMAGILLFFAACTSIKVENSNGDQISNPIEDTIDGIVTNQFFLPSKGGYYQTITVQDKDSNIYKYKIHNNMFTSKTWKINKGDSVRMVFDENGDSHVYKK